MNNTHLTPQIIMKKDKQPKLPFKYRLMKSKFFWFFTALILFSVGQAIITLFIVILLRISNHTDNIQSIDHWREWIIGLSMVYPVCVVIGGRKYIWAFIEKTLEKKRESK